MSIAASTLTVDWLISSVDATAAVTGCFNAEVAFIYPNFSRNLPFLFAIKIVSLWFVGSPNCLLSCLKRAVFIGFSKRRSMCLCQVTYQFLIV